MLSTLLNTPCNQTVLGVVVGHADGANTVSLHQGIAVDMHRVHAVCYTLEAVVGLTRQCKYSLMVVHSAKLLSM